MESHTQITYLDEEVIQSLKKDLPSNIELDLSQMESACSFECLLDLYGLCLCHETGLHVKALSPFFVKDKKTYVIPRNLLEKQAQKARLDLVFPAWKTTSLTAFYKSHFRMKFKLDAKMQAYVKEKGYEKLASQAYALLEKRLFVSNPVKDGKQTPFKGHPIFLAQHATATCCRGCLEKWHHIPKGKVLNAKERQAIIMLQLAWIKAHMDRS